MGDASKNICAFLADSTVCNVDETGKKQGFMKSVFSLTKENAKLKI